ncbi:restriction endonuclease subunit S [Methylosoma difficile]
MKYRVYSEYKDSDISWLCEIPLHWKLNRFKNIFQIRKRIAGKLGFDILSITQKGVKIKDTESGDGQLSMDYSKYQLVYINDFAMNHMDLLTGFVDLSKYNGVTSPDYRVFSLEDKDSNKRYCLYLLQLCYIAKIFYPLGQGAANIGRWRLPTEAFNEFIAPSPHLDEQEKIANFLDHETAKIDALIAKQQRLIELLKEKRQAVISHAVTKGLNPDVPMRDSGVEWFDELPKHWTVGKLGYYSSISNGATPSRDNPAYWESGTVGWLNSSKVNDIYIQQTDQFITPLAVSQTSVKQVKPNHLVIAITGEGQTRGRVAICKISATINQHLAGISINDESLHHEYLFYWITSQYERIRFESSGAGSTKGAITCEDIKSYCLPVPPLKEQQAIISHIVAINKKLDLLIDLSEKQVFLSQERRTALISAAVTGKIDVRDFNTAGG